MASQWLDELRKTLEQKPPIQAPKNKNNTIFINIIAACACAALFYAIYFSYTYKSNCCPVPSQNNQLVDLERKVDWLVSVQKNNSEKFMLLGSIMNNNSSLDRKMHPKIDYMYINTDWTIDKIPPHLSNIQPREKEVMERHLSR